MMRRLAWLARCGALVGALAAVGCGFRPLYAPAGTTNAALSEVFVDVIANRNGQLLRQSLQERLDGDSEGEKRYELSVLYIMQADAIGVQSDSSVTRTRFVGHAKWVLKKAGLTGATVASGSAQALDGANDINSQFFYLDLSTEAVDRRMGDALADQIVQQIAAYFRAHGTPA
jgi:LPS-assembly lipoprotein